MTHLKKSRFTTIISVRPDDIDMNNHVHSSRYMDIVLAARYIQMHECYGVSMEQFREMGYTWMMTESNMHYKRSLILGDNALVTTWIEEFKSHTVWVHFEIKKQLTSKICCSGWFKYTMVDVNTGKAANVPANIIEKYSI